MLVRMLGLGVLGLSLMCFGIEAAAGGKDTKDKDDTRKFEIPKGAIAGTMKSVNFGEASITIIEADTIKDRTFKVDNETKFIGPRGGISDERLKDDRLARGYEVHVLPDKTGKLAKEVHLPFRKKVDDKKDKKGK